MHRHRLSPRIVPRHAQHLVGVARLDGHRRAGRQREVEGWRGHRGIERNAVVGGGERLVVGADLVADVAIGRDPIGAHDDDVDLAAPQQEPAGAVDEQRVRDAARCEFPRREIGTLQPRARLADPDVNRDSCRVGHEHRRERGSPAAGRERACVAVRHDPRRAAVALRDVAQQREAMQADRAIDRHVFRGDGVRFAPGGVGTLALGQEGDGGAHAIERPAQVDRGGPRRIEHGVRMRERGVRGIAVERQRQAVRTDGADQRCAAHPHLPDRQRRRIGVGDRRRDYRMRQCALIDGFDETGAVGTHQCPVGRGIAVGDIGGHGGTHGIIVTPPPRPAGGYFSTWNRLLKSSVHRRQSLRTSTSVAASASSG